MQSSIDLTPLAPLFSPEWLAEMEELVLNISRVKLKSKPSQSKSTRQTTALPQLPTMNFHNLQFGPAAWTLIPLRKGTAYLAARA